MISLTKNEKRTLLILLKDYTKYYNANTLSKELEITHVGAQKLLKRLKQQHILISKTIGKSIVYKLNFNNDFTKQLILFILTDEANDFQRWVEEFSEIFSNSKIVLLYGSTVKNYAQSKDIDVLIVTREEDIEKIDNVLKSKQEVLPKKIHALKLTRNDFLTNVNNKTRTFVNIIRNAVVLNGQEEYLKVMQNVTRF